MGKRGGKKMAKRSGKGGIEWEGEAGRKEGRVVEGKSGVGK